MLEAINQATCTECDSEDATFDVTCRNYVTPGPFDSFELARIVRALRCDSCQARALVSITEDGLSFSGSVSYEDASWNQEDEE